MNRARFLITLAGGALGLRHLAAAERPAEKAIYDLLDAAVDAEFTYDFPRLAALLHPSALQLFRSHLSARFDQLLRSYTLAQIVSVSGLSNHPQDLTVSDAQIFVAACYSAGERHPEFVGDPKLLPLKVHGILFDNDHFAHVLFSYSGAIRTERTDFDYAVPNVLGMRRGGDTWQINSSILARRIIDDWWRDLATPKNTTSAS